jgi:hypothetical protein
MEKAMSQQIDGTYDVYREQLRCAAKEHTCDACSETIAKGHRYFVITWVFDRSASGVKRCLRCQAIHKHLRSLGDSDMWPDEELNCGEEYTQHWGVEPPEHIAALAFKTQDELQG